MAKQYSVRATATDEQREAYHAKAKRQGLTLSDVIRILVEAWYTGSLKIVNRDGWQVQRKKREEVKRDV